jgi:hypothetical protein
MLNNTHKAWIPYVGTLAVLLILFFYSQHRQQKYEVKIEPIFNFRADEVTSLTIRKETSSVTLVKMDASWKFATPDTGKPAPYKMDELFKDVIQGQREDAVTSESSDYGKYGVTADKATKVELKKAEEILSTVFIGQSPTDNLQEYIRYNDDPRVYPARQKMIGKLGAVASWWR